MCVKFVKGVLAAAICSYVNAAKRQMFVSRIACETSVEIMVESVAEEVFIIWYR